MTIKIRIETDNAAFEGDNIGCEIARILRRVAEIVDGEARKSLSEYSLSLLDVNGNAAGFAVFDKLEPGDEDEDEDQDEDQDQDEDEDEDEDEIAQAMREGLSVCLPVVLDHVIADEIAQAMREGLSGDAALQRAIELRDAKG